MSVDATAAGVPVWDSAGRLLGVHFLAILPAGEHILLATLPPGWD